MKTLIWLCNVLIAAPAIAADVPEATTGFVNKVTVSNKFEIDTSKLALEYGKDAEVKKFADQMIADHGKAGEEFKAAIRSSQRDAGCVAHRQVRKTPCLHDRSGL